MDDKKLQDLMEELNTAKFEAEMKILEIKNRIRKHLSNQK